MPGRSRWFTLPGLALTNVVPLVLVTQGLLSTADLLMSYLLELYFLIGLWLWQRRPSPARERVGAGEEQVELGLDVRVQVGDSRRQRRSQLVVSQHRRPPLPPGRRSAGRATGTGAA